MSISDKLTSLQNTVEDIRQSIVNKDVPVATTDGFKVYPDAVRAIDFQDYTDTSLKPTIHGVNYYDYNGDLLYVYTPQEFLALSAHPSQPAHTGLVADGWNWDLTDAQSFVRNTCDCLNIGGHYATDTGDTRLYIRIPEELQGKNLWLGFYYRQTVKNGLTIDWGDGTTSVSTATINGSTNSVHTYTNIQADNFLIKVTPLEDCIYTLGNTNSYVGVFGYVYNTQRTNAVKLVKVEIGKNVSWQYGQFFRHCVNLETVSIPKEVNYPSMAGTYQFCDCTSLKGIVIPEGITSITGTNVFSGMNNLRCFCAPKSLTSLQGSICGYVDSFILPNVTTYSSSTVFRYARYVRRIYISEDAVTMPQYLIAQTSSLEELHLPQNNSNFTELAAYLLVETGLKTLEIPASITSMGNQSAYGKSLETVIMRPTTPPTAASINIFYSYPAYLKIHVPYSADHSILNAYKTATNWTQFASRIYELDENGNIPT